MAVIRGKKINFRNRAISRLQEDLGMTKEASISYYNRIYRNALKQTGGHQKELNVTREVFASMFYETASTFQIGPNQTITLNPIIKNTADISKGIAFARMDNFFNKYSDDKQLQNIKQAYENGKISKKEFNEKIKEWKATTHKYLISGS